MRFLISPSLSPQRLVFCFSGELEGMTERGKSILPPCPYLPVHSLSSSLSTVVPKGHILHCAVRVTTLAKQQPRCFLSSQLSPLSPRLWPHGDCFLKPPAREGMAEESLVVEDNPAGLASVTCSPRCLCWPAVSSVPRGCPQQWQGPATLLGIG